MQTIEYRTDDKRAWGPGPWQAEPDKKQWTDEATGMPCLIVRSRLGALCGYVGVPEGHLCFQVDHCVVEDRYPAMWVHGGLTFSDFCQEGPEEEGICHLVEPGEPDRVWWLGFDCAHGGDLVPKLEANRSEHALLWGLQREFRDEYRDLAYVTEQVASLAAQLARLA
jgi:hypothetical protein